MFDYQICEYAKNHYREQDKIPNYWLSLTVSLQVIEIRSNHQTGNTIESCDKQSDDTQWILYDTIILFFHMPLTLRSIISTTRFAHMLFSSFDRFLLWGLLVQMMSKPSFFNEETISLVAPDVRHAQTMISQPLTTSSGNV